MSITIIGARLLLNLHEIVEGYIFTSVCLSVCVCVFVCLSISEQNADQQTLLKIGDLGSKVKVTVT